MREGRGCTDTSEVPLRLSLSLPGAASLGAYQAGAVAALAVVVEELRRSGRDVRVDAIGGVSAGAIVALFYAHSLLTGADAASMLRRGWVDDVDAGLLRSRSTRAPLDFSRLEPKLREELGSGPDPDEPAVDPCRRQRSPVGLSIGLTNLLGLTYEVDAGGAPLAAMSFVDWGQFVLDPGAGPEQLVLPRGRSPVDFALASAAHPLAFAPRMLERSHDRGSYEARGITNLPGSGCLWYSDGGLVESGPIGRVLEAAHAVAGTAEAVRLHVVVDPRSAGPSGSRRWGDPDAVPSWLGGIRRAMSVLPSQALHEDLRHIADTNRRLAELDDLVDALVEHLGDGAEGLRARLAGGGDDDGAAVEQLLRRALARVAGVDGKERVRVVAISPLLLARELDRPVPKLLAGDVVGAFGGFLSRRLRESDFVLGWDSTLAWTQEGFAELGISDDVAHHVREVLAERRGPSWDEVNAGRLDVGRLERPARLALARLIAHMGRVLAVELLPTTLAGRPRRSSRTRDEGEAGRQRQQPGAGGTGGAGPPSPGSPGSTGSAGGRERSGARTGGST